MSSVKPIRTKQTQKLARRWVKSQTLQYQAIYHIGVDTGLRTSDITKLKLQDVDFNGRTVTVIESKGTLSARARARLKILATVKSELIAMLAADTAAMMAVYITKPKDIYPMIPSNIIQSVDNRIAAAMATAPPKTRIARLSLVTIKLLTKLKILCDSINTGYFFDRRGLLSSNRAMNTDGVISRQSVYKLWKRLEAHLNSIGERVTSLGAHSARKTAALNLYNMSQFNIALVMKTFGWSSEGLVLRYLSIESSEADDTFDKIFLSM